MSEPKQYRFETREAWLTEATARLRATTFDAVGYDVPPVRVACGWPSKGALSASKRRIGECWKPEASADGVGQIFISPFLSDAVGVLETLVHELIHAVLPEAKHGRAFKEAMKNLGLEGKAPATHAGEALRAALEGLAKSLGEYPHSRLDKTQGPVKPDRARMLKIACPSDTHDPYILRGAQRALDMGLPNCPVCGTLLEADAKRPPRKDQ